MVQDTKTSSKHERLHLTALILPLFFTACQTPVQPTAPGSRGPEPEQPRTLEELKEFLAERMPATWEIEKGNRLCGRDRDENGNWKWSCIIISNPKDSEMGRQVAQEMGTLWSSLQLVAAQGDAFILIGSPELPEVNTVADLLGLSVLSPPKDIRTFVVEDCGLIWNGLTLERYE